MKILQTSGKRKTAIAKATIRTGKGHIRVNNVPYKLIQPRYIQLKISEAILLAGNLANTVDIDVVVSGGGQAGQAEAVRLAISRSIIKFAGDDSLKQKYISYDRQLLVADVRRKESSKPNRHGKARAKVQKSYR